MATTTQVFCDDLAWNNPITRRTLKFFCQALALVSLPINTVHMTKYINVNPLSYNLGYDDAANLSSLYLVDRPDITTNPMSQLNVVPGTNVTFTVVATGSDLTYQWQRNGGNLTDGVKFSGTTTPTLTVMNVMEEDEGNFTCVVTNVLDSVTSSAAQLTVYSTWCPHILCGHVCLYVCMCVCICICVYTSDMHAGVYACEVVVDPHLLQLMRPDIG